MQGVQSFRFDIPLLGPTFFSVCQRKLYRLPLMDPENKERREGRLPQKGGVGWPLPSPSPCQAPTPVHQSPIPSLDLLLDRGSMGKAARRLQRMTGMLTVEGGHLSSDCYRYIKITRKCHSWAALGFSWPYRQIPRET